MWKGAFYFKEIASLHVLLFNLLTEKVNFILMYKFYSIFRIHTYSQTDIMYFVIYNLVVEKGNKHAPGDHEIKC